MKNEQLKKAKSPKNALKINKSQISQNSQGIQGIVKYRGVRSLFALRTARREALGGKKIPLLHVIYTTAFLQVFIVICITTIITLRKQSEYFFLNTTQSFEGIFELNNDNNTLLKTSLLIPTLQSKFNIFFSLSDNYCDHYFYPQDILIKNESNNHNIFPNYIPTAVIKFKDINSNHLSSFKLNQYNYSVLSGSEPYNYYLINLIQNSEYIDMYFEIESFSFNNDIRNLWKWYIHYKYLLNSINFRVIPSIDIIYDRTSTEVSWWDQDSYSFMGSVIASFGLFIFSVFAILRFIYKYGCCFIFDMKTLKILRYRILLPISHFLTLICGFVYLINLSNIADLNDKWELRLSLAISSWFSWCMLVFAIQTQGTEYGAFFATLKRSFKPIMILLISLFPIMIGFILFGSLLFGVPDGQNMFTTPEISAKTLYAVWLGDEVLDTFYAAGVGNAIAEIYMYAWGILFIAMIFNIGLVIVESNFFDTIPQLELPEDKPGANLRDLQRIKEYKEKQKELAKSNKSNISKDDNGSDDDDDDNDNDDINDWRLHSIKDMVKSPVFSSFKNNIVNSFEYKLPDDDLNVHAVKLNELDLDQSIQSKVSDVSDDDFNLIKQEKQNIENQKYITKIILYIKKDIKEISKNFVKNDVRKYTYNHPMQSQGNIDLLQTEILEHYKNYLKDVSNQVTQMFVKS